MSELHFPWLEISVLLPLLGALQVARLRRPEDEYRWSLLFQGLTFFCAVAAWQDFELLHVVRADDRWHLLQRVFGHPILVVDQLSAPLLPLVALQFLLTTFATLRTKAKRFSFVSALLSESLVLATFSCQEPWVIIGLLSLATLPPYLELRDRGRPTGVYVLHMSLFVVLMVLGWTFLSLEGQRQTHSLWAIVPLLGAVFIRSGIVPVHCWMTDLFEHATFGTALLFVTPITGAYLAVRLVLPIAPDWVLHSIGLISLITAVYAAGMALVQREARRFFCYLFLSHSALVLVGLEMVTPIGLTGALCVWLSVGLSLVGFGLTLRALEARRGRLMLRDFQGLYEHTPTLAVCFGLTGLASVGFPGTVGFVGMELLVDGAVESYPFIGAAVVVAAALNGIAIVQVYFRIFTGTRHQSSVSLGIGRREQIAVLSMAALILVGGVVPQPGVATRHRAAEELLRQRADQIGMPRPASHDEHHGHDEEL
ncbi:MAG: proton-conducting transporter membrane subunit [Pirellulales bacterium]